MDSLNTTGRQSDSVFSLGSVGHYCGRAAILPPPFARFPPNSTGWVLVGTCLCELLQPFQLPGGLSLHTQRLKALHCAQLFSNKYMGKTLETFRIQICSRSPHT